MQHSSHYLSIVRKFELGQVKPKSSKSRTDICPTPGCA